MHLGRHTRRMAAVAALVVAAVVAVGCSSSAPPPSSGGGTPVKGGTALVALPAGITYNWIFPFYAITNASVYNGQQFQWLMYRPLYMFGNNTNTSPPLTYPLCSAPAPVYWTGGSSVGARCWCWKWSDGSAVDAKSLLF